MEGPHFDYLMANYACGDGFEWAITQDSLHTCWRTCPHGDWLLWLVAHIGVDPRLVVRTAAGCARLGLKYAGDMSAPTREALELAESWSDQRAELAELAAMDRKVERAWVEAHEEGKTAEACAVKAAGSVLKAALTMEKHRNRACQFAAKASTWAAEAARAQAKKIKKNPETVAEQVHQLCAEHLRAAIPADLVDALIRKQVEREPEVARVG